MMKRFLNESMKAWPLIAGVFVAFLALYAATAQRGVGWQDSGEFQYRVLVGDYYWHAGLARSHPLYILIARGFAMCFPAADRFYAINLCSGVGMATALAFLAALIWRLTASRRQVMLAVAFLGLSHMAWWMATIAEVYTWSLAALMAELYILSRYLSQRRGCWLAALFAVNGLHLALHNTAWLSLPVYLLLLSGFLRGNAGHAQRHARRFGCGFDRESGSTELSGASFQDAAALPEADKPLATRLGWLATAVAAWLAGAGPLVVLAVQEAVRTGEGLATLQSLLFGTGYQARVLGLQAPVWRQAAANFALAGVSLLNPCWLLALPGVWRARPVKMRVPLLALTALHLLFWIRYFVPDQATFVLPMLGLLAVWIGIGHAPNSSCMASDPCGAPRRTWGGLSPRGRAGLVWLVAGVGCAVCGPLLLRAAVDARGTAINRSRSLPFRNEARYWLLPWKQNERSAGQFVQAVGQQLDTGDVLVADATAAGPLLAARAAGRLAAGWRLVTPWSGESEAELASFARRPSTRLYVVSPVPGYVPAVLLATNLRAVREGVLWRVE
jgi:hypothetical protein